MAASEIGEYTGCKHGPNGERLYGCIPCALQWHTLKHVENAERAEHHLAMARRLEDEQINRKLAASHPSHDEGS